MNPMTLPQARTLGLPRGRSLTRDDLDAMPDDGHRYEIIDGTLIVSPAPIRLHQRIVTQLVRALEAARPDDSYEVLVAPFDVVLAIDTVVQPDVLVAREADLTDRDLPAAPMLAVEVLSPGTRRVDLLLKRSRYESAGVRSYWIIDPDAPSLTALELRADGYVEIGSISGEATFVASKPYAVEFSPADLVHRR